MKLLALSALFALAFAAPRDKRLAVSTITVTGGLGLSTGCVVTGNVLYANGFRVREITPSEQQELVKYQNDVAEYKTALKQAIKEREEKIRARLAGKKVKAVESTNQEDLPKPPQKPSFCTPEDTTQFFFEGCMIQNNKIYVGNTFARDLTQPEISELKEFEKKFKVYQDYVQKQAEQQVNSLFGGSDFFSALFSGGETSKPSTTTVAPELPEDAPEQPPTPNFCTRII
ncbi:pepsin inhibitor-3-like repeated domain protein [Ancylostoma caninum]|uniref:Aspartyl protease inhibitor 1 n=1 Tax=Ancylostoma caninum TaxID=29170 RepID=Q64FN6_ANCCA|nr:aspartyl protease inhibitor 1 [Ancylostoma caninum]RCN24128.1 pepsin inhibitor-3-like repeated domain protein [Ancylostoma caninum]